MPGLGGFRALQHLRPRLLQRFGRHVGVYRPGRLSRNRLLRLTPQIPAAVGAACPRAASSRCATGCCATGRCCCRCRLCSCQRPWRLGACACVRLAARATHCTGGETILGDSTVIAIPSSLRTVQWAVLGWALVSWAVLWTTPSETVLHSWHMP